MVLQEKVQKLTDVGICRLELPSIAVQIPQIGLKGLQDDIFTVCVAIACKLGSIQGDPALA